MAIQIKVVPDASFKMAESLLDGLGRRGVRKKSFLNMLRRAVNAAGSTARRLTLEEAPRSLVDAPRAAFGIKGKAAHPGQDAPVYKLRLQDVIDISRLRSQARFLRKHGKGSAAGRLLIKGARGRPIEFQNALRPKGARTFTLLKAGPLEERGIGGVRIGRRTFHDWLDEKSIIKDAHKSAQRELEAQMKAAFVRGKWSGK